MTAAIVQHQNAPISDQIGAALEATVHIAQLADDGRITLTPGIRAGLHAAVESLTLAMVAAVHGEFEN